MGSARALRSSTAACLEKIHCKRKCPTASCSSSWAVTAQGGTAGICPPCDTVVSLCLGSETESRACSVGWE